jgi:hypothetical protein
MKKEKMSLEKMKSVLSHVLSREEMKEVMAGSGGGGVLCGVCWDEIRAIGGGCYIVREMGGDVCRCLGIVGGSYC